MSFPFKLLRKRNIVIVFLAAVCMMILIGFVFDTSYVRKYYDSTGSASSVTVLQVHRNLFGNALKMFNRPSAEIQTELTAKAAGIKYQKSEMFKNTFNNSDDLFPEIGLHHVKTDSFNNVDGKMIYTANAKEERLMSTIGDMGKNSRKQLADIWHANSQTMLERNQKTFRNIDSIYKESASEIESSKSQTIDEGSLKLFRNIFNISNQPSVGIGLDNRTDKNNYLIYRCDDRTLTPCGGLIDRIKGIGAAYLIANLTGRTFKLEMLMKSCDFHRYLIPNHVDWHLPVSFHETVLPGSDVSLLSKINDMAFLKNPNLDFLSMPQMQNRFVYHRGNTEFYITFKSLRRYQKQLSWIQHLKYSQIVNAIFRRLFRPSSHIQEKTKKFFNQNLLPHEKLVCAHLRTGINPSNPNDTSFYKFTSFGFRNTWDFFQRMTRGNDSKIFLMSDSEDIIRRAKGMPFGNKIFSSPGRMVHIDKSSNVPADVKCEGLEKIIFEHYVLLHCDVLLISRSGIGIHAASVRDTDKGLYCLGIYGDLRPCERKNFIDIYKLYHII